MALARAIVAIAILLLSFAAQAEKRVALVIGNGAYTNAPPLANPKNDAEDMAVALRALGFTVILGVDLDKRGMDRKILDFANALSGADTGVFHYSGHGLQVAGVNYLVPVDAALDTAAALDFETVRLDLVQRTMEREAKTNILFLDACRNNPLARNLARALGTRSVEIGKGLASTEAGLGTLIGFSTQPGNVALDGAGRNSPFSGPLAKAILTPGKDLSLILIDVRKEVLAATGEKQVPWEHSALLAPFYFKPAASTPATPVPPLSEAAEAWRVVEHSDSEAVLEAFIKRFGETVFGDFARARLGEIRRTTIAAVKPAAPAPEPAQLTHYEDAAQRLIRTFTGHTGAVYSVAVSPNGRTALSGGCDEYDKNNRWQCVRGSVKLWDIASGSELRSFVGHTSDVFAVAFSPDGQTALSGGNDKTLKLWDVASGQELRSFAGHGGSIRKVMILPDGLTAISGSDDNTLKLWVIASARELRTFTGHTSWISSVAISPDGRSVLSSSCDKTIKLWDIASGKVRRTFNGHMDCVQSVAISPDGSTALSGGNDEMLKLWNTASGHEFRSFTHTGWVWSVTFSPDGRTALSGNDDKTLKLWDIASGRELRIFTGHTGAVFSVAFSPDGRFALSGSQDKTLKLWDISEWTQPQEARR